MACGYEHMIDDNGMQQMKYMYADMWMRNDDLEYSIIFDAANQAEDKYYLIFYATFHQCLAQRHVRDIGIW